MADSGKTRGIARIVTDGGATHDRHVGMGIVVGERHVMTCCHVLNDALGRLNRMAPEPPPTDSAFRVCFPYAEAKPATGRVVEWGLSRSRARDIAVLELERSVGADTGVAVFGDDGLEGQPWSCTGFDEAGIERSVRGRLGPVLAHAALQLDGESGRAPQIEHGYSGAAFWVGRGSGVRRGMVVAIDPDRAVNGVSYAIPTEVLTEIWPALCRAESPAKRAERLLAALHRDITSRWERKWSTTTSNSALRKNPPFIASERFRLLIDTERPERHLQPESFRGGTRTLAGSGEDAGRWIPVGRDALVRGTVTLQERVHDLSRMMLVSDAGMGKTTELRWLQAELTRAGSPTTAFLLRLGDLPDRAGDVFGPGGSLHAALAKSCTDPSDVQDLQALLAQLLEAGRIVLLLDALDQVPSRSVVATLLEILTDARWRRCRIVISGRPNSLQTHWAELFDPDLGIDWRFVYVDEFTEAQQRAFLGKTDDGRDRLDLIPVEAREILSTPRVLEHLRDLSDDDLLLARTATDVYWRSVEHLLREGMRNCAAARRMGIPASDPLPDTVQARSLRRARTLLAAIAIEMTSERTAQAVTAASNSSGAPNFDGVRRAQFEPFRRRLLSRLTSAGVPLDEVALDRDLAALAALNSFVYQGFFDAVEGLQEVFWRSRTLQEYFTAYWLSHLCTKRDASLLEDWLYVPQEAHTEEYYWVWRFLAELPNVGVDPASWCLAAEPVFRPACGARSSPRRSTEFIYHLWGPAERLSRDGVEAAAQMLGTYLKEFETEVLSGKRGPSAKEAGQQLCASFVEVPAGEFRMGAPHDKQDLPVDTRRQWQHFLETGKRPGLHVDMKDPVRRLEAFVDAWWTFPPGKLGRLERRRAIDWWMRVFREKDLDAVVSREYPKDQTSVEPVQRVDAFRLGRIPTSNAWFRLFSPRHGGNDWPGYGAVSPSEDAPAIYLSWYDAWAFARWARWKGASCRLPREYEWEYAAKAGARWDQSYWWGDEMDPAKCNAEMRTQCVTVPTPEHANPWGLIDILGNVWEWTADEYQFSYDRRSQPSTSGRAPRSLRGGAWNLSAFSSRCARRLSKLPSVGNNSTGLRLARG